MPQAIKEGPAANRLPPRNRSCQQIPSSLPLTTSENMPLKGTLGERENTGQLLVKLENFYIYIYALTGGGSYTARKQSKSE